MWSISSEDVERAKERVQLRRSEIETRYAEALRALDAELETLAMLERAAADFTSKKAREDTAPEPALESSAETAAGNGGDPPGTAPADRRESGPGTGSRWRLHLGNRPLDLDGSIGNTPTVSR